MSNSNRTHEKSKIKWLFLTAIICAMLLSAGCLTAKKEPVRCERTVIVLGTAARFSAEGNDAENAVTECIERLENIAREIDAENPESSIARLNADAGTGDWIPLSPEAWHILSVSQQYSSLTDGAWDATIGPLTSLWRKALATKTPPAAEDVSTARAMVDWKKLELRESDKSARLSQKGMTLDLGGAFKGYALDECRRIYAKRHVTGLIDLGTSSIAAVGGKTDSAPFRIALRHPRKEKSANLGIVNLKDAVLSTSGDYEHCFLADGVRYHHLINTHTGYPAQSGLSSVSIRIAATQEDAGLVSDMLSTAFFVMGAQKSHALLPTLPVHIEAVFADEQGNIADSFGNILEK